MRRAGTRSLAALLLTSSVLAAEAQSDKAPVFEQEETLAAYLGEYSRYVAAAAPPSTASLTSRAVAAAARTAAAIPQSVDTATLTADRAGLASFASRLHLGIESIDAGDEEGSFVIKWNQHDLLSGSFGLSATVRQAAPAEEVLGAVAVTDRKALEGAIDSRLGDLDDLTFALAWTLERSGRTWGIGRRFEIYDDLLANEINAIITTNGGTLLDPDVNAGLSECEIRAVTTLDPAKAEAGETLNWRTYTRQQLATALGEDLEGCLSLARKREEGIVALDRTLDPLHLLAFLVDNQPQLVVTGLLHRRDQLAGRDGWELSVSYEHGLCNLNKLLGGSGCGDDSPGLTIEKLGALETSGSKLASRAQQGQKLTFTARYSERDHLVVDRLFGADTDVVGVHLDLPTATELGAKLQYSRNATWQPLTIDDTTVYPKLHISSEYEDVSDDPQRRDRWIAKITYEVPLTASATLPLTLSYANHAKFLGEVDDELSVHFGLSYAIKTGKKKAE